MNKEVVSSLAWGVGIVVLALAASLARKLGYIDSDTVTRLVEGSKAHAVRRGHEMAAAVELLEELGVPARVSAASRDWLHDLEE